MNSPRTKAASILTRCGSCRHQKAMTNSSRSGAGCHRRQGKSENIQTIRMVNQMNRRPDGCLNGEVSMGCRLDKDDDRPVVTARLFGLCTMLQALLGIFPGRNIKPQNQEMTLTLGGRERLGNRLANT